MDIEKFNSVLETPYMNVAEKHAFIIGMGLSKGIKIKHMLVYIQLEWTGKLQDLDNKALLQQVIADTDELASTLG